MVENLIAFCTSRTGLYWLVVTSDVAIAAAYFAIPVTMAVVFHDRRKDIPFPRLWVLFVVFILACGVTHLVHLWGAVTGIEQLGALAVSEVFCAVASVGTAVAFAYVLPEARKLPSPREREEELERAVSHRTRELDRLLHEVHHRLGNQLQILISAVNIESRRADTPESAAALGRIKAVLDQLANDYTTRAQTEYVNKAWTPSKA